MARKTVILTAEERAICRVRYRQVATYMDPGPQPLTPNDRICQAIAAHWPKEKLEHGAEYSDLLFPFGNKRAVSRHINKGSPKTESADREIALAWVETQPKSRQAEILAVLGLVDTGGEGESGSDVNVKEEDAGHVKDEEGDVKQEATEASLGEKRKRGVVEDAGMDSKDDVLSKRPRGDAAAPGEVKKEAEDAIKTET